MTDSIPAFVQNKTFNKVTNNLLNKFGPVANSSCFSVDGLRLNEMTSDNFIVVNTMDMGRVTKDYRNASLDTLNDRAQIRPLLYSAVNLTKPGSIIGLNDYTIYDGIIGDEQYATFNVVNEFLMYNKNWYVDGLALHSLGFYDIYLRRK